MKRINPIQKYFLSIMSSFRTNIRDYGMYIALVVIFIVFTVMTGGLFLGPINFTNLLNQTAYVAVLAVGMTLVIVTRQIDLSVGFLGAFLGAFMVVSIEKKMLFNLIVINNNFLLIVLSILSALVLTIAIGFIKGLLVAKIKVPSFVVTLAAMFIFKGLLMIQTDNKTIPTSNEFFQSIGIGYLSEHMIGRFNTLTIVVGLALIILLIFSSFYKRSNNIKMGVKVEKLGLMITKLFFTSAVLIFLVYTLASFRGISFALLIAIIVVIIYHILTTQTVIGRKVYAVGGNPDAAELSGISVSKIIILVFVSMGILSLVAGIMYVSRVQNTSPQHGVSWELYAIASAYIGGTSANGGAGKVINSAVGAVTITALTNGMALAGINANLEPIILGAVLALAVIFDIYTRNVRSIDLIGVYYANIKYRDDYLKARREYYEVQNSLREATSEDNVERVIELEYELTKKQGDYNRVRDLIRSAKEEDFLDLIK